MRNWIDILFFIEKISLLFRGIISAIPDIGYICVDVANGYSEHFVEFVRLVRKEFPDKTIIVW